MDRRRYLTLLSVLGGGALAGCRTAEPSSIGGAAGGGDDGTPQPTETRDEGETPAADGTVERGTGRRTGRDGIEGGDSGYGSGTEGISAETVSLELWDRFVLDDTPVALIVTGTDRLDTTGSHTPTTGSAPDVFVVSMVVENVGDDPVELDHDLFWLEGLPPSNNAPAPALSADLEDGLAGERAHLGPGAERTLELAFSVPESFEPSYLWVERFYVCLV